MRHLLQIRAIFGGPLCRASLLLSLFSLISVSALSAPIPTTLRVVDLRGIAGQPELETWLGSLQGAVNRQEGETAIFLIRNDGDAEMAAAFTAMYHLKRETFTPGALLEAMKPTLAGQILYAPTQPWTRNVALTAAAVADGTVLVTDTDRGLRTLLDLRDRWTDRRSAYAWAREEYGAKVDRATLALAPESGYLFGDLIVSRRWLAVDLAVSDDAEKAQLSTFIDRLPAGGRLLGNLDDRNGNLDTAFWTLTQMLGDRDRAIVPVRNADNLSCLARFPLTRPVLQRRDEAPGSEESNNLTLIYAAGGALDGSQSLDYAAEVLPNLLADPALTTLAVGIETPSTLREFAPGLYQWLLARQQNTAAELIAAPNGDGWALPMTMADARSFLARSARQAGVLDISSQSLFDTGGAAGFVRCLTELAAGGLRGAFTYPLATASLADKQARASYVVPNSQFTGLVGVAHARTINELRTALAGTKGPFTVIYLDPFSLPPGTIRSHLPEISAGRVVMTPSQMLRTVAEYVALIPWLQAKAARGVKKPTRDKPTLRVATPTTTVTAPTAATSIPITVQVTGAAPVLTARLIYTTPRGQMGAADLRPAGDGLWQATLPPTLTGGAVTVRARVVERGGYGVTFSDALTLDIPVVDGDADGLDDAAEAYRSTDPATPDTDHDGLPDGYDPDPLHANRDTAALMPAIFAPADGPWLAAAGASTADARGRHLPAGGTLVYRLPLQDILPAPAALQFVTSGAGTIALAGGAPSALAADGDRFALTELPLDAAQMAATEIQVTLKAGDAPLTLSSIALVTNPKGPYILPITLSPTTPPADVPIFATAVIYSANQLKSVHLRYGTDPAQLATLDMGRLEGTAGAVLAETIPGQRSGTILLYGIEAEDVEGNRSASPLQAVPIGKTRKPTFALLGTRDLKGAWEAVPIWGGYGRASRSGAGADTAWLSVRQGKSYVWVLAQPLERGIQVKLAHQRTLTTNDVTLLNKTLPAGSRGGWYLAGSFDAREALDADMTITPVGDAGFCAYGMVVVTQDEYFKPPLAQAGLDWFNTLTISGLDDDAVVGKTITLRALPTGNIDAIRVTVKQLSSLDGRYVDVREAPRQPDGSYALSTRGLPPGKYQVSATGLKTTREEGGLRSMPIVTVSVTVTVPKPE